MNPLVQSGVLLIMLSASLAQGLTLFQKSSQRSRVEICQAETEPSPGLKEATVPGTGEKIYLHKEILITNKDLISATAKKTFGELFEVILTFREAAAKRIAKGMRFQSGRRLAILVDGKIISAPIIRGAIIDKAAISDWAMTKEKAERLANAINGR